ncbi:MAG: DNA starvation/stationary phase protection protein [Pseudomonadota bacterium]
MATEALNSNVAELPVKTGIEREDRKKLAEQMGKVLASSYVLYHKTHAYHWNITGPLFYSVHKLTDEQYEDLAAAIDDIAERIRAIGFQTPVGLGSYLKDSVIEDTDTLPNAGDMIRQLADDNQAIASQLRDAVMEAEKVDDVYTADLLTARVGAHEEASWMLNSLAAK